MRKLMNFAMLSAIATVSFFGCNPKEDEKDPTAAFTVSPEKTVYEDGEEITFTDASVANSGTITQWSWDFGDGTPKGTTATVKHTYKSKNTFTVKLTVVNSSNKQASATKTIQQKGANQAPAANFVIKVGTQTQAWALAGDEVSFENTSTDPDVAEGDVLTYSWDFGDGSALSTEKDPKHTYAAVTNNTNYTVKLVVTDSKSAINEKTAVIQLRLTAPQEGFTAVESTYDLGGEIYLASPAVNSTAVYMVSNGGKLMAFNKTTLTPLWLTPFDMLQNGVLPTLSTGVSYPQASSPVLGSDGTIYISTIARFSSTDFPQKAYLYAINPDGTKKWEHNILGLGSGATYNSYASPVIDENGYIYIGARGNGTLIKIKDDGNQATLVWQMLSGKPSGGVVGQLTLNTNKKHIYVPCGNNLRLYDYSSIATSPPTGDGLAIITKFGTDGYMSGQVAVNGNYFYVASKTTTTTGFVSCFSTNVTGTLNGGGGATITTTPNNGWQWSYPITSGNPEKVGVSLNSDGSVLYIGDFDHDDVAVAGKLYAVNTADGSKKWEYETEGLVGGVPAVDVSGYIHFGDRKGYYYVLNSSDGTAKYKQKLGSKIQSSPVIDMDGNVYIGVDQRLVKISTGVLGYPSSSPWPMRGQNNFRTGAK